MISLLLLRKPRNHQSLRPVAVSIVSALLLLLILNTILTQPKLFQPKLTQSVHASSLQQTDGSVIAYVSSSIDNQEIRTIHPDGTNAQLLWRIPDAVDPVDGIGLGGLSWHPDATELAFDSGHDWQGSMAIRDLYSVTPNGSLRRISNPPSPDSYDQLPEGTVNFTLDMLEQGDVQLYIEGMDAPYEYFARLHETWTFTLTLADFGESQRQHIRVWDPDSFNSSCHFSEEGWVDVVPNTQTNVGTINFGIVSDKACPVLFSPSWNHDGSALNFVYREPTASADPENNLWQAPHIPQIGTNGQRLLNMYDYVSRGKIYRVISGPTQETANDLFFVETGSLNDHIYYAPVSNAADHSHLNLGTCPKTVCDILDIEWLPDGSGFVFSRYESEFSSSGGALYRYDIETANLEEITRLADDGIGNLAISPDGETIVFERGSSLFEGSSIVRWGSRLQCSCSLWTVDADGSNLQMLVEDGRQPAWSPTAPDTTPQPTATPNATTTPEGQASPEATPSPTPAASATPTPQLTPMLWLPLMNQ